MLAISGTGMLVWPLINHGGEPRTTVVVPGGQGSTIAYSRPSTHGYAAAKSLLAGTPVTVVCTAYGEPNMFQGAVVRVWNYTDKGWLNDHFVGTGGRMQTGALETSPNQRQARLARRCSRGPMR